MSSEKIVQTLNNISKCLQTVIHVLKGEKSWMTPVLDEIYQLTQLWEFEWTENIIKKGLDLGHVTTYDGSVFNPKEIAVTQVTAGILGEIEKAAKEMEDALSKDATMSNKDTSTCVTKNIVTITATYQYIPHTWSESVKTKLKDRSFQYDKLTQQAQSISRMIPKYDEVLKTIGM